MKLLLPAALVALSAIPPIAAEPLRGTRAEILALSPAEVSDTLLGNISPRFVTMAADEEDGHTYLRFVRLATAPEGTGLAGLCQAKALQVALAISEGPAAPPTVWSFTTYDVYKVVGQVDGPLGPLEPGEEEQARLCADAGPVVVSFSSGGRGARFFQYRGYGEPWLGVTALQGLIRGAREGDYNQIECTRRELNDCRDPRAELGALNLRDLKDIEVVQPDPDQPNFRVRASFVVDPGLQIGLGRSVSFEFNGEPLPVTRTRPLSFRSFHYGRTQLSRTL